MNRDIENKAKLFSDSFKELSDIESIIIRGHILIEHELNDAITRSISNPSEFKSEKFTFSQKTILCYMIGIGNRFKSEINTINKLRNQIAHTLSYDEKYIDLILKEINLKSNDLHVGKSRVDALGASVSYICGALSVYSDDNSIKMKAIREFILNLKKTGSE